MEPTVQSSKTKAIPVSHLIRLLVGTALILLIPLIAMQFTDQVNWTLFDFVIAGSLLLGSGLIYEVLMAKAPKTKYQALLVIGLTGLMILVWVELAVGIFG